MSLLEIGSENENELADNNEANRRLTQYQSSLVSKTRDWLPELSWPEMRWDELLIEILLDDETILNALNSPILDR